MTAAETMQEGATPHPSLYGPPARQFDAMPRWLRWSGLSQVIGPTAWAIYQALVMVDHQTMGLPSRRHGREGMAFEVRQEALERGTGFGERAIRLQTLELRSRGLLCDYRRGIAGHPSRYEICRPLLVDLYRYVGPILEPEHQGIRGVALRQNLEGGLIIYGYHDQRPLIAHWEQLSTWQHQSLQAALPEVPKVDRIRAIVEKYVENQPESDSGWDTLTGVQPESDSGSTGI